MDSNTKCLILLTIIAIVLTLFVSLNHDVNSYNKYYPELPAGDTGTLLNENLFVDEINAGPMNFESAKSYCKSRGMHLPTRDEAWEMWLASSNCKLSMVTSREIIKDKKTFNTSCHNSKSPCTVQSGEVEYRCNPDKDLLFLDEKSYRYGNYWLKDRFDKYGHYTANFINGVTNAYRDDMKLLGVRCVRNPKLLNK